MSYYRLGLYRFQNFFHCRSKRYSLIRVPNRVLPFLVWASTSSTIFACSKEKMKSSSPSPNSVNWPSLSKFKLSFFDFRINFFSLGPIDITMLHLYINVSTIYMAWHDFQETQCTIKVLRLLSKGRARYSTMFKKFKVSNITLQRVLSHLVEIKAIEKIIEDGNKAGYEITAKGKKLLFHLEKAKRLSDV